MSHTDVIILISTGLFASTFGVYAIIRVIKQYTRPPVNMLERSGDIELVDYIEHSTNYQDLLVPPPIYGRIPSY
jgi:hypothetical protein